MLTTDGGVRHSAVSVCMCVCLFVCLFVYMIKPKRLKLGTGISIACQLILDHKVKGQGHRVTKCKNV